MGRTIIVSNRLPIKVSFEDSGLQILPSVGGLATGLSSIHPKNNSLWIGWTGLEEEETPCDELKDEFLEKIILHHCIPISLSKEEVDQYYHGFSNNIIWPLFHYFTEYAKFSLTMWEEYKKVNEKFAEEVFHYASSDDLIWVHDYHLMLLPELLRNRIPDIKIGFFLHIPFPSFEIFRTLPFREEILTGILGANVIGFHTYEYQHHFLECVSRMLPAEIDCNSVKFNGHASVVNVYPMGIDAEKFEKEAKAQLEDPVKKKLHLKEELQQYTQKNPEIKYVLSIDRLDYTKGIVDRIKGFEYFLEKNPWAVGKVRLLMVAVPSRTSVPQYQQLKKEIDELVGGINSKYATLSWSPILYFYRSFSFKNLVELYSTCDIALITPIRDGMNLVAKEYVMSRPDQTGVLILSEMAGAAKELPEALLINPISYHEFNETMLLALTMSVDEQKKRMEAMQKHIKKFTVNRWAQEFIMDLKNRTESEQNNQANALDKSIFRDIQKKYLESKRRLFLLDYDGTLTGFTKMPERAVPDIDLLQLLSDISAFEQNEIYIISGRDHTTLSEWFDTLKVNLIAEHGVYKKRCFQNWTVHQGLDRNWMNKIKPLLEKFVAQTPGSFIEEKTHSLAWHYRQSPTVLGNNSAVEIIKILKSWSSSLNIQVLKGNKVIEITNAMVNKGSALQNIISTGVYDFIIAIGDDHTDEFLFRQLPQNSVSIKVGTNPSCAGYRLKDFKKTRLFLSKLIAENSVKKNKMPPAIETGIN